MGSIIQEIPDGDLVIGERAMTAHTDKSTGKGDPGNPLHDTDRDVESLPLAPSTRLRRRTGEKLKFLWSPNQDELTTLHRVLLAWTILLERGSIGHQDEDIEISWKVQRQGEDSDPEPRSFKLSEAVSKAGSTVTECLTTIGSLRSIMLVSSFDIIILEASIPDVAGARAVLFAMEVQLLGSFLELTPSCCNSEICTDLRQLLLSTYYDILEAIDAHQTLPISELSITQSHELEQIWSWNSNLPVPINRSIHEYFAENAQRNPSASAVTSYDATFTYGELDTFSNQLAFRLRGLGIQVGSAVPCCFEKSAWTVVAALAIMKAGAAFVLTDPSQPEGRLKTIFQEVDATVILTSRKYEQLGKKLAPEAAVLSVDPAITELNLTSSETSLPRVAGDDLMYIIFTSGSTGKPKGVMISHSNYTSGAIPRADIVGYKSDTRVLDFASYAFDVSIDCMLLTLATGGCICVPSDEQRLNDLSGAIREMKVNMVHTTPSIARVFDEDVIPNLQVLGLGGEAVPARDASQWNQQTRVIVAYGPSECTVGCAFSNDVGKDKTYTSLGKGCGGLLWIVDPEDHDKLSPVGATGELLVEGPIVGKGYLNEPGKTATAFIENPKWLTQGHKDIPGRQGQLYKTGDLVKYDPDGSGAVVFVGRKDQQVKIRGQRVELEEVEHHLRQTLPSKTAVAAEVIMPGGDGEPSLVAFVAGHGQEQEQSTEEVHSFAADFQTLLRDVEQQLVKNVPKYMVPASFISIARIPTTVSGKTDRKTLRAIGSSLSRQQLARWRGSTKDRDPSRPLSDREKLISQLWTKILGDTSEIDVKDNFFALGGDSLKAMKLVTLARAHGLALSIGLIFGHPTLADMASKADNKSDSSIQEVVPFSLLDRDYTEKEARQQAAKLCAVDETSIDDICPCTPLQEGLMALSSKTSDAYIAQRVLKLRDKNSAQKLQYAFDVAAKDCPILRTRIIHVSSRGLFQVVLKDCSRWQKAPNLQAYLRQDRDQPMDLGTPLCRFGLVEDQTSHQIDFVLTMHHALYDGWSMPLLVDRVNRAYHSLESVQRTPFTSFIKHFRDTDRQTSESYWQSLLDGAEERQCPALPYAGHQTKADSLLERHISVSANAHSTNTLATIVRAAWAVTAAQYTEIPDVVFGETLTGRNADVPGIEEIEAPLITTVPMRIRLSRTSPVSEFLEQVHQQTIDRIPHEQLGLQNIRLLSRDARSACDLRTGLVLHPCADDDASDEITEGPASGLVPAGDNEAAQEALKFNSYALMLVCTLEKKGFLTMASFDSKTICTDLMQELLQKFEEAVQELSTNSDRQLGDIFALPKDSTTEGAKGDTAVDLRDADIAKTSKKQNSIEKFEDGSASERYLARVWARILKIDEEDITSDASFFDLGGDSIGAMKLVSELRTERYEITVAQIFEKKTLGGLTKLLTKKESQRVIQDTVTKDFDMLDVSNPLDFIENRIKPALSDDRRQVQNVYPARPLQTIAVKGTTDLPRYSVRYEQFSFDGHIDKHKLFKSCRELVSLNEILRTVFVNVEGLCYAVVIDDIQSAIVEYEIDGDVELFSQSLCDIDVQSRMPEGSDFVKFFYVENKRGQSSLIFRLSHSQYDEICLPNMLRQLSASYRGQTLEKSLPYSTYVRHLLEENIPKSKEYWKEHLQGSQLSILPGPKDIIPDRAKWSSMTKTVNIADRPKGITLATYPTAAWALTLARRLSKTDIVFGEVASGRNTGFPNADSVIGPCWQYIPFRLKLDKSWTHRDLLEAVQTQHISSSQFEGIGLSEIIQDCTDWPQDMTWFDSVVHQDVVHVESLPFSVGDAECRMKTYYPHLEPLREWKVQAFARREEMVLEIVTFEAWKGVGGELLDELVRNFEGLVGRPDELVFE